VTLRCLYDYFRSTSSYRVRIALARKGIEHDTLGIHLLRAGGEHLKAAYHAINPQRRVPSYRLQDGTILTQSPAIIAYLEEVFPIPALLSKDPVQRARIRAVAAIISCGVHPLGLGGRHGEEPPGDTEGFLAFARELRTPTIYNAIRHAKRLGGIVRYGFPESVLRHFERLDIFPRGLLPIADASIPSMAKA
jgi:glutathione S-transferase